MLLLQLLHHRLCTAEVLLKAGAGLLGTCQQLLAICKLTMQGIHTALQLLPVRHPAISVLVLKHWEAAPQEAGKQAGKHASIKVSKQARTQADAQASVERRNAEAAVHISQDRQQARQRLGLQPSSCSNESKLSCTCPWLIAQPSPVQLTASAVAGCEPLLKQLPPSLRLSAEPSPCPGLSGPHPCKAYPHPIIQVILVN